MAIVLAVLTVAAPIYASTVLETSVREMIAGCDLVFEGRVVQIETRMDPDHRVVHTFVRFQILDVIKGGWPERIIELSFLGGNVDGRTLTVAGMQIPELDELGIYFVEDPTRPQVNPLYGWKQGHLRLNRSKGDLNVFTADGKPIIGIESVQRGRSGEISRGVAAGLVVGDPEEAGMRAEDAKRILRSWVEESS